MKKSFYAKAISCFMKILIACLISAFAFIVIISLGVDLSPLSRYDQLVIMLTYILAGAELHAIIFQKKPK